MAARDLHVLLLEDDIDLGQAVTDHLEAQGWRVSWMKLCSQARKALAERDDDAPQVILLDLRLPDGDGIDLIRAQRQTGDTRPVLALTARDQVSDRIRGLQAGADDYLVKPFDLDELVARIEAVERRALGTHAEAEPEAEVLEVLGAHLDFTHKVARREGQLLSLTAMEWALIACLAQRPGRIWSRPELEATLYPSSAHEPESNSLEVLVSRLRRKLGAACITTHRGMGYRLER